MGRRPPPRLHTAAPQAENSHSPAKIDIRRRVLAELTPAGAHVFDAFAGTGSMHAAVWHEAASYVGCDEQWHADARLCFVGDNRRVLRSLELTPFTVFDLDAFGCPWEQALVIAARRPALRRKERIALVLTDGTWPNFRSGALPWPLRLASGVPKVRALGRTLAQSSATAKAATAQIRVQRFDDLLSRAVANVAARMSGRIVREWRATAKGGPISGTYMRYLGVVIEGAP